ncbi:hypothetical protein SAMN02745751_02816, partial [Dethiosulfatibacter aminovorans DSM 17477]
SVNINVGGVPLSRSTNGVAPNSGPATKTWVDAYIYITPLEDTNMINDTHTFTATVMVNDGSGWTTAPDGTTVNFNKDSGPGNLSASSDTTTNGDASVNLTSSIAGTSVVSANVNITVGGVPLYRFTDGNTEFNPGEFNNPAIKHWIAPEIETACAAHVPGDYRFTEDGNWFTYVDYERVVSPDGDPGESTTSGAVNIYASKDKYVGYAVFTEISGGVEITIHLDSGWYLADGNSISIQDYASAPDGIKAVPGSFDYQYAEGDTIVVPLNNFYAIHIDVYSMP